MSVKEGDIVYVVWRLKETARRREVRKLHAIAATYAAAIVAAPIGPDAAYEIVEYRLK